MASPLDINNAKNTRSDIQSTNNQASSKTSPLSKKTDLHLVSQLDVPTAKPSQPPSDNAINTEAASRPSITPPSRLSALQRYLQKIAGSHTGGSRQLFSNNGHLVMPSRLDRELKKLVSVSNHQLLTTVKQGGHRRDNRALVERYATLSDYEKSTVVRYLSTKKARVIVERRKRQQAAHDKMIEMMRNEKMKHDVKHKAISIVLNKGQNVNLEKKDVVKKDTVKKGIIKEKTSKKKKKSKNTASAKKSKITTKETTKDLKNKSFIKKPINKISL